MRLSLGSLRSAVLVVAVLLSHAQSAAEEFRGRIVGITDGDTLAVLTPARVQKKVRLAGIDAPEKGQAFGQAAKRQLSELAFQQEASVRWDKEDRYGRIVGVVVVNGEDVGLALLRSGFAWHFKRYAHDQSASERIAYSKAEDQAKAARLGLWRDPQAVPPWEYRSSRRRH